MKITNGEFPWRHFAQWCMVALLGLLAYLGKGIYEEQLKRSVQVEIIIASDRAQNARLDRIEDKLDAVLAAIRTRLPSARRAPLNGE